MTEYTIDMIKGTTVMEQMRSLIKVVIDFINEDEGDIEEVRQMIQTEIADRTAQDGQLQLQIQAEATARISQDNALTTQIQTEVSQREAQVQQLTADIEYEQQTRQDSDDALETAITSETSQRETADTTLQGNINTEAQTRFDADSSLYNDIQQIIGGQSVAQIAAKLQTARNIQVALDSSVGADFDGSANVTPGVQGVLPIQNGGTGRSIQYFVDYESQNQIISALLTIARLEPQLILKNPYYAYDVMSQEQFTLYRMQIRDINDVTFGEDMIRKYETGNLRWSKILHFDSQTIGGMYILIEPNNAVSLKIFKMLNGTTTVTTIATL